MFFRIPFFKIQVSVQIENILSRSFIAKALSIDEKKLIQQMSFKFCASLSTLF